MDELNHRLEDIFREVFQDNTLRINDETKSDDVARWDSLGHLRLLSTVEREFDVTFTLDETMSIVSVSDLKRIVKARAAGI